MSTRFPVGSLVIMQHATYYQEYDGFPAVVIGGYNLRLTIDLHTMEYEVIKCYRVRILAAPDDCSTGGVVVCAQQYQLRKLEDGSRHKTIKTRDLIANIT